MHHESPRPSILARLRAVIPRRPVTFSEALQIAELQASKLNKLLIDPIGIHEHHIAALPRIAVHRTELGEVSGISHWTGTHWLITLNKHDPLVRPRFTLLHEFKHIIDHGSCHTLYHGDHRATPDEQAERAADYFAGCALISRRELKAAWGRGMQRDDTLAAHFGVSQQAIRVRLIQTGLTTAVDRPTASRCARPVRTSRVHSQRFRTPDSPRPIRSYA